MTRPTGTRLLATICTVVLLAAACGDGDGGSDATGDDSGGSAGAATIRVPEDHDTIQEAVDAGSPGDLVLIAPGVYNEEVTVTIDQLTIRGLDRNEVILDGEFERETGITAFADGVAIENMTARNFTSTGFYWTGVSGFRGSYLTAYRNGTYGIYSFDATDGQFDNSHASGHADAGFYVGQCYPCNVLIDNVIAEHNGLGYSGTNGGEVTIVNSVFRNNRAGVVPNTGSYQLCYPNRGSKVIGNQVYGNSNTDAPGIPIALTAHGNGILLAGAVGAVVERNWVSDHERTGIGLVPFPEEDASDLAPPSSDWDRTCDESRQDDVGEIAEEDCEAVDGLLEGCVVIWNPFDNRVTDNAIEDSGVADLAVGTADLIGTGETTDTLRNCFSNNDAATSAPAQLEQLAPCDGEAAETDWDAEPLDLIGLLGQPADAPSDDAWQTAPVPPEQPQMPDADSAPARPATDVPMAVDLEAITRPEGPTDS